MYVIEYSVELILIVRHLSLFVMTWCCLAIDDSFLNFTIQMKFDIPGGPETSDLLFFAFIFHKSQHIWLIVDPIM